jgi:hypothetical protein
VRRIGLLLCAPRIHEPALKLLVLAMNRQQRGFEYEFLPVPASDPFLRSLRGRRMLQQREVRSQA